MKYLLPVFVIVAFASCRPSTKETLSAAPTLTKMWETDTVLTTCESVIYDTANDVLYVSNINGDPSTKDGNGFISKVGLDGKVLEAMWIAGLDAPKGMGIHNGNLFVSDINRVHEIDIAAGKVKSTYSYDSAQFLNDITIDSNGVVYISDSGAGMILKLEHDTITLWLKNLPGVNGLLAQGTDVQMVSFATGLFNTIDVNKTVTFRTDSIDNGDGLEALPEGGYLVSSWNGMVHYISPSWENTMLLDTRADNASAADIEYIPEKRLLLVPTFFKNKVVAYELSAPVNQ